MTYQSPAEIDALIPRTGPREWVAPPCHYCGKPIASRDCMSWQSPDTTINVMLNGHNRCRSEAKAQEDEALWAVRESSPHELAAQRRAIADLRAMTYAGEPPSRVVLVDMSTVVPEAVTWLWPSRLPFGKVTVLDGDPGLGKSTIAIDIAARLTTGRAMPDGTVLPIASGVVICSAEDGLADTIRPRLEAAGADLSWVAALTVSDVGGPRSIAIPDDLRELENAIEEVEAGLVIIDPLMAHLPGTVNSYRDQDVRRALGPLAAIAERTGAAVLVIRHLNKATGGNAIYRGGGSIGIIGAARSGLLAATDPDDETRRVLAVVKSNLAPLAASLSYVVETVTLETGAGPITTSRIGWGGTVGHSASALLAIPTDGESRGAVDEASDILEEILAAGPMKAREAQAEARQAGVSDASLRRARASLGVTAERRGGLGAAGCWYWSIPPKAFTESLRSSAPNSEHLRETMNVLARDEVDAWPPPAPEDDYPQSAWDEVMS